MFTCALASMVPMSLMGGVEASRPANPLVHQRTIAYPYGAIAVGGGEYGDKLNIMSAKASGLTKEQAERGALSECNRRGALFGIQCYIVASYSKGCQFVAIGVTPGRTEYFLGTTWNSALNQCRSSGLSCKDNPVGSCIISGYDLD